MPKDMQKMIDAELAKGNLLDWKPMRDFLISFSDSESVASNTKPVPIAAAVTDEQPPTEPTYSDEDWHWFLKTEDGIQYVKENPNDQTAQEQLQAMHAKGSLKGASKGSGGTWKESKGKGKDKGKGTGDKGKCKGKGDDWKQHAYSGQCS